MKAQTLHICIRPAQTSQIPNRSRIIISPTGGSQPHVLSDFDVTFDCFNKMPNVNCEIVPQKENMANCSKRNDSNNSSTTTLKNK